MPIMTGQEFRARQLSDTELAAIPTVVMSAADRIHDKTAGMNVEEALAKPINLPVLVDVARRYCGER